MPTIAEGDNYELLLDEHRVVHCRVWRRRDLDSAAGARCAEEMLEHVSRAARDTTAVALIYDLRQAPPVSGPRTERAFSRMLTAWTASDRRVAIVVGDVSLRRLQMQRIVSEHAPHLAAVFDEPQGALSWVGEA